MAWRLQRAARGPPPHPDFLVRPLSSTVRNLHYALTGALALVAMASPAVAQAPTPFCRRVRAEAESLLNDLRLRLVTHIDTEVLFSPGESPDVGLTRICQFLVENLKGFPTDWGANFRLLHVCRFGEGMKADFRAFMIEAGSGSGLRAKRLSLPPQSGPIAVQGSGAAQLHNWLGEYKRSNDAGTSRACFAALCDSIQAAEDPRSGGCPQLAGLTRQGPARIYGIVFGHRAYLCGCPVHISAERAAVAWFNDRFEVCDPASLTLAAGAQPQPRPPSVRDAKDGP